MPTDLTLEQIDERLLTERVEEKHEALLLQLRATMLERDEARASLADAQNSMSLMTVALGGNEDDSTSDWYIEDPRWRQRARSILQRAETAERQLAAANELEELVAKVEQVFGCSRSRVAVVARDVMNRANDLSRATALLEGGIKAVASAASTPPLEWAKLESALAAANANYQEEVDEFNAGYKAAQEGQPESDEPHHAKYDVWAIGYAWAKFGRKCNETEAELTQLRQRIAELEPQVIPGDGSPLPEGPGVWFNGKVCYVLFDSFGQLCFSQISHTGLWIRGGYVHELMRGGWHRAVPLRLPDTLAEPQAAAPMQTCESDGRDCPCYEPQLPKGEECE